MQTKKKRLPSKRRQWHASKANPRLPQRPPVITSSLYSYIIILFRQTLPCPIISSIVLDVRRPRCSERRARRRDADVSSDARRAGDGDARRSWRHVICANRTSIEERQRSRFIKKKTSNTMSVDLYREQLLQFNKHQTTLRGGSENDNNNFALQAQKLEVFVPVFCCAARFKLSVFSSFFASRHSSKCSTTTRH